MPCVVIPSGIFEFEHAHFLVPMKILFSEVIRYKESPVTPQALLKKKSCCCCTFFISNTFWRSIHNTHRAVCVDCKIIYMLFTGFGRSVLKLCPRSWVLRPKAQFLPIRTDQSQWITFLFFSYWDLKVSGKFSTVSLQPMCVSCWWSARSIANQSKILQHDS